MSLEKIPAPILLYLITLGEFNLPSCLFSTQSTCGHLTSVLSQQVRIVPQILWVLLSQQSINKTIVNIHNILGPLLILQGSTLTLFRAQESLKRGKQIYQTVNKSLMLPSIYCNLLYTNIDQTLLNKLHGPTHCKIGDTGVYNGHVLYTLL